MMKLCSKCKTEKDAANFYPNKRTSTGLTSYCKACIASLKKKWLMDNPEAVHGYRKKWKAAHPDLWNAIASRSRLKRKSAIQSYGREYQQAQRDTLSDNYVTQKLKLPRGADIPESLIELKRAQLQVSREISRQNTKNFKGSK